MLRAPTRHPQLRTQLTAVQSAQVIREGVAEVEAWFSRLDCLVVGPGLGRDPLLLEVARACIARARVAGLPLLLDGDALFLVAREPELVRGAFLCRRVHGPRDGGPARANQTHTCVAAQATRRAS